MRLTRVLLAAGLMTFSSSALAQDMDATVGFGLMFSPDWFGNGVSVGGDWAIKILPYVSAGAHFEIFGMASTSSDGISYNNLSMQGMGVGPTVRVAIDVSEHWQLYLTLMGQVQRGERIETGTFWTITPGTELGVFYTSNHARVGLFYKLDYPTYNAYDFGGMKFSLVLPGFRFGFEF